MFVALTKGAIRRVAESTLRYKEYFGYAGPVPLNWYLWSEYRPRQTSTDEEVAAAHSGQPFPAKDGFKAAVTRLREQGVFTQPYVNARVFDIPGGLASIPPDVLPYTVKDQNGQPRLWAVKWPGMVDMCRSTQFFQDFVRDVAVRLARDFGARGAYLDQFTGLEHACFDSRHGHAPGGGDWQYHALRQLGDRVRAAVRSVDPDAVFSGENFADAFIDILDGNLYHHDVEPGLVPLVPAVYGGYWITYGRGLHATLDEDLEFRMSLGNLLVYGVKLGRFATTSEAFLNDGRYARNMALLKQAVQMRVAAREYLQYGRFLRPLRFEPDIGEVVLRGVERQSDAVVVRQPAVMSSVWLARDGSLGIVLFNITATAQTYQFSLPGDVYASTRSATGIAKLNADGTKTMLGRFDPANPVVRGVLNPDEIQVLVVR